MLKLSSEGNAKRHHANLAITILLMLLGGCSQDVTPIPNTPGVYVLGDGSDAEVVVVDRKGGRTRVPAVLTKANDKGPLGSVASSFANATAKELFTVSVKGCPKYEIAGGSAMAVCTSCIQQQQWDTCPLNAVDIDVTDWHILK